MARIQFGNTWWGSKWLEALDNFDYANRLPRGVRYARNGSVRSVEFSGNRITARVAGTRPTPYKVTLRLPGFNAKQTRQIVSVISSNPYYLSQLEGHLLPKELLGELEALGISLLPDSWEAMGMHCSCPDWAVPCKHLAAVVYLIANEIDKNPFLIFSLHGFDLEEQLKITAGRQQVEPVVTLQELYGDAPASYTYDRHALESLDMTSVPQLSEALLMLLTPEPLFYPGGDFKAILAERYRRAAKHTAKRIAGTDMIEDVPEAFYSSFKARLDVKSGALVGELSGEGLPGLSCAAGSMGQLCEYLQSISIHDLGVIPPQTGFLAVLYSFSLILLERGAYVPELIALKEKLYGIRWVPALIQQQLEQILSVLVAAMPSRMVTVRGAQLPGREQLLFLISQFIGEGLRSSAPKQYLPGIDPLSDLFFEGVPYRATGFDTQENAQTMSLWLSRFFMHPHDCSPVISIEEFPEQQEFTLDLMIDDRGAEGNQLRELNEFLASDHHDKFAVLKDLNLLSTYLPAVNQVLRVQASITLDADEFVPDWFAALPVLETLGVRTIFPKSLKKLLSPSLTLSLGKKTAASDANSVSYLNLQSIMEFNWTVALGTEHIDAGQFMDLVEQKSGLIRFKDQYLLLDPKDIARMQKQMEKKRILSSVELLSAHLSGEYQGEEIVIEHELKLMLDRLFTPAEISEPEGLQAQLRDYQRTGFTWLYHNYTIGAGSILADDMGLGKTLQVIACILKQQESGALGKKGALIIAPASVLLNWQREIQKFAPSLCSAIYHGPGRDAQLITDPEVHMVITTYALARSDTPLFKKRSWCTMVLDEAQYIKNSESIQAKAIRSIKADYRIAMTGTPVENRLLDYWSISEFTMKNLLGNKKHFKSEFAIPIEKFNDQDRLEVFKRITAPFMIRRMKSDSSVITDLPDKVELDRWAQLTEDQSALYTSLIDSAAETIQDAEGMGRRGLIFKLITGLKQICDHPVLFLNGEQGQYRESGKSRLLMELLEKIRDREEKVLIFTQFRQMGLLLQQMIASQLSTEPLFFHGGLTQKKRNEMVDAFEQDEAQRILIISLKAGGTGLNLTAANNVIHYDLWWNPAVEAQATDRAFRIGQRKGVNVYRLITRGTFEERINDMLTSKKELANMAVNQGEHWISEMSDAELKDLLQLSQQ